MTTARIDAPSAGRHALRRHAPDRREYGARLVLSTSQARGPAREIQLWRYHHGWSRRQRARNAFDARRKAPALCQPLYKATLKTLSPTDTSRSRVTPDPCPLWKDPKAQSFLRRYRNRNSSDICRPILHQLPPSFERIRSAVCLFGLVADDMCKRCFGNLARKGSLISPAQSRKVERKP